ncbi:MAG: fluoride efflux transporter CrcB [Prevotella sp.]|nr:fluoride efflux transporter CrcB [Prevotella sp.]MDD7047335.1 fluoride efflux transporter CrcB [Prevotella sp.]MDY5547501.1 fluoride efflux transporter CrcB [Prevotella sp.]
MKELLLVSMGSFFGGGMRFLVSKVVQQCAWAAFPFGTLAVNVLGCLFIGFLSGLSWSGSVMSPSAKLLLTTGFCGGFTTFSTFMNEGSSLMKDEQYVYMTVYLFGSLALGLVAVLAGHQLAKLWA